MRPREEPRTALFADVRFERWYSLRQVQPNDSLVSRPACHYSKKNPPQEAELLCDVEAQSFSFRRLGESNARKRQSIATTRGNWGDHVPERGVGGVRSWTEKSSNSTVHTNTMRSQSRLSRATTRGDRGSFSREREGVERHASSDGMTHPSTCGKSPLPVYLLAESSLANLTSLARMSMLW